MKVEYRGFEIDVRRERCLGGWDMLYTTIMRISDGWFLEDTCEDSGEKVRDQVRYMKGRVDNFILHPEEDDDALDALVKMMGAPA